MGLVSGALMGRKRSSLGASVEAAGEFMAHVGQGTGPARQYFGSEHLEEGSEGTVGGQEKARRKTG